MANVKEPTTSDTKQPDPLYDMATAHDFLFSFLVFNLAPFHRNADGRDDGDRCALLEMLRRDIDHSTLTEGAKEWANNICTAVEMSWKLLMDSYKRTKLQ